ncbi:hypothetical protein HNR00_002121 [Methylorubrum rhodinum]|uniref:Uncharacterized protein n=1 Tax=Methylorubrum rhodinum TaxID=29428 RepID=A0A840ZJW4_9HYPH|nr:hypothetical protein [Methylorubrum rhodinum]MBB5757408.1 hypothetical protein [Methylorubrum rhodinum]
MRQILTSDQFVAGVIAVLALQNKKRFILKETELDERFEKAFEELLTHEDTLKIATNFTFYVDPMHGDSVCLRDTLLAAREKALISINNPTLQTFDIKIDDDRALRYLKRIPLPRPFLTNLVNKHFGDLGVEVA